MFIMFRKHNLFSKTLLSPMYLISKVPVLVITLLKVQANMMIQGKIQRMYHRVKVMATNQMKILIRTIIHLLLP